MNFLSSESLAAYLEELWDDDDFTVAARDPVSVDWDLWSDAGDYSNNCGAEPLPDGPWYVSGVNGSVSVAFSVPKAWVTTANGSPSFKFDDEGPCEIVAFIEECESLRDDLHDAVMGVVRDAMIVPEGRADDSLDGFRVVLGEAVFIPAGHETRIDIEARIESI